MTDFETNRKIAEARGWWLYQDEGSREWNSPGVYNGEYHHAEPPDYLHDPNAALEAAAELLPKPWSLIYDPGPGRRPWCVARNTGRGEWLEYGHAACEPLCDSVLKVLAERKEVKP